MRFNQEPVTTKGVTERAFELECEGRVVPGIVWTPERVEGPRPLVLIGHGGSGHKREPHILGLARRLVRHDGIAAAAIDGPMHGDRKTEVSLEEMRRRMQSSDSRNVATSQMVSDWKATLDALQKLPEIGVAPVGYWGLSMGTMFGLPFVAADSADSTSSFSGCCGNNQIGHSGSPCTSPPFGIYARPTNESGPISIARR